MNPAANPIEGVEVTPLRQIADARGAVLHVVRSDTPGFDRFGECYFSEILPGKVKAWKKHLRQTQTFAVPVGRIRLVIFDDRPGSPTHGSVLDLELGRPDRYVRVRVPPGVWYGFACVGDGPGLMVNCADLIHDPAESVTSPVDDPGKPRIWA